MRRFIVGNALMWLRDFDVDGLRLDAVHALLDERALTLVEELTAEVDALSGSLGRPLWLIAESDRNDPRTVMPRAAGGQGFAAQWNDDVHHALHVLLTGETQGYYADFAAPRALAKVLEGAFFHDGTYSAFRGRAHGRAFERATIPGSRFVVSLQTHDQVGNRAQGDRLSDTLPAGLLACGAALLLTGAGTPMLFMGEEWGASTPWQYFTDHTDPGIAEAVRTGRRSEFAGHGWTASEVPDPQARETFERSRLDWDEPSRGSHARLLEWYRGLIRLRRERPDLRDPRLERVEVEHREEEGAVIVRRGAHVVVANLGPRPVAVELGSEAAGVLLAWEPDGALREGTRLLLDAQSAAVLGPRA